MLQWKWSLDQFLTTSKEYKSDLVLRKADGLGLKDAATRNLDKQRSILREPDRFRALLQEMPRGEPSDLPYVEEALKTIKSLLNVHRGELREWFGGWEVVYAPLPDKHDNPGMWHDQFFPPDAADPGAISTVLSKPASGGGHLVRVAIVIGLADLFFDYGQVNSAAELYELWEKLRVFAHRRPDTISRKNAGLWRQRQRGQGWGWTQRGHSYWHSGWSDWHSGWSDSHWCDWHSGSW